MPKFKIKSQIARLIRENQRFLIAAHDNLDGDAVGSGLALCLALKRMGKKPSFFLKAPIPLRYNFLPGIKKFVKKRPGFKKYDILFILDTASWDQLQELGIDTLKKHTIVNIDHHIDNPGFGKINWIDKDASAVGEQIYLLLKFLKIPATKDIAKCLYTSILTDTGCFQFANTTPETHNIAADLIKRGVSVTDIYEKIYEKTPLSRLKLLRTALGTLKTDSKNKIIWIWITQEMFKKTRTGRTDTEGIIDYLKTVNGIKVAVIFKESGTKNEIRVTFRSKTPDIHVNEIARKFGGGGHPAAAGCTVHGTKKEAEKKVIEAIKLAINMLNSKSEIRNKSQTQNSNFQNF